LATGALQLNAVVLEIDDLTGKARRIEAIQRIRS